jgi:outer membrane protein OmpA-like peptidoglycan-associated protein
LLGTFTYASEGLDDIYELYQLERYEEALKLLEKEDNLVVEVSTLMAFCYYNIKDFEKCLVIGETATGNKSDSLSIMMVESYIAVHKIVKAEERLGLLESSMKKDLLDSKIATIKEGAVKMVCEDLGPKGAINGICLTAEGEIIYAVENKLMLNDVVIYKSEGQYVGTPFISGDKIYFSTNVYSGMELEASNLRRISKKKISKLQLFIADYSNGKLSNVVSFKYNNVEYDYLAPFIDAEGNLFFSSNASGGLGGYDIYKCNKLSSGLFDQPVNIANPINSPFDDLYYRELGNRIYYSSEGNDGFGGLDLLVTMEYKKKYTEIVNLGSKVNSNKSDYSLSLVDNTGYFVSISESKIDNLKKIEDMRMVDRLVFNAINKFTGEPIQIHKIESVYSNDYRNLSEYEDKADPYDVPYAVDRLFSNELLIVSTGYAPATERSEELNENKTFEMTPNFYGTVHDNITEEVMEGVKVYVVQAGDTIATALTDTDGSWWLALDNSLEYDISYVFPGYKTVSWNSQEVPIEISSKYGMSIESKKGNVLKIRNIYFELGKADLKEESKDVLDRIITYLEENSMTRIELSAHTDSRGSNNSNLSLSEKRAQSAYVYLIANGIDKSRLVPVGYGETKLSNRCKDGVTCSDEEHQENRRVEMKIL